MDIAYQFNRQELLDCALTHKSAGSDHNERLEFLGDAVLGFVIAEALYLKFPKASEGQLSRLRARLVNQTALAAIARELSLGERLNMGMGEKKSGGQNRDSLLSDALEALIAAIYLDNGEDLSACKAVILPWFSPSFDALSVDQECRDAKSRLQEWLQSRQLELPKYSLLEQSGPDNQRVFTMECAVESLKQRSCAQGVSKKEAEQKAAEDLLKQLQSLQ